MPLDQSNALRCLVVVVVLLLFRGTPWSKDWDSGMKLTLRKGAYSWI